MDQQLVSFALASNSVSLLFNKEGRVQSHLACLLEHLGFNFQEREPFLLEINQWAQQHLLRSGERWHIQCHHFQHLHPILLPILKEIGLVDPIYPSLENYDRCLFFGATLTGVRFRLYYLLQQWNRGIRFKEIIFLGGERPLEPAFEGVKQLFFPYYSPLSIREDWNLPSFLPKTEHEMMQVVWEQTDLPDQMRESIRPYFINTPQKQEKIDGKMVPQRPDTASTLEYWLKQTSPCKGTYLAISDQPHARRQDLVARTVLPDDFLLETIGDGAPHQEMITDFLDELARWIYQITLYNQKKSIFN